MLLSTPRTFSPFTLRNVLGWDGAIVAAVSLAVYAWPYRGLKSSDQADLRIWWWVLPFALSLLALTHAVHTRHPYLNPFNPDRDRLAAERVLSLKNNIVAGVHADWVMRYARQLDERGETQGAIHFYREAVRLNPDYRNAYARLIALENQAGGVPGNNDISPAPDPRAPYWTADSSIIPPARRRIDARLENVEGCTVIIVPVGEVPDTLLDAVGYVIHQELNLPVYISPTWCRCRRIRGCTAWPPVLNGISHPSSGLLPTQPPFFHAHPSNISWLRRWTSTRKM